MSRVLVTGGTGFIGSHLVERLVENGFGVRCLVRERSDRKWLEGVDVEYVLGDVVDAPSLEPAIEGVSLVFHLAAKSRALTEEEIYLTNATGTVNLMKTIVKINPKIRRFVYVSSLAAAGPSLDGMPIVESDTPHPVTPYGASKLAGEEAVLAFYPQISSTIVRPPVVYGPRDVSVYTFYRWIRRGVRPILGVRKRYGSFIFIDDLIDGILAAAEVPRAVGQTYFLVGESFVTYQDLTGRIAETLGKRTVALHAPATLLLPMVLVGDLFSRMGRRIPSFSRMRLRELSQRQWVCDGSKAGLDLGFKPRVDLQEGIRRTTDWYRCMGWV